jgi:branched-chain amino acid aminotransferase
MAAGFSLSVNPWVYLARYGADQVWTEHYEEKPHRTPAEEERMAAVPRELLLERRNSFPELPLVNYTTQYGMGCFEGLKAMPQPDGTLRLFRPADNARRMHASMQGLHMPPYPPELFVRAVRGVAARNQAIDFAPAYDAAWEKDNFATARSLYIRPFSYAEGGIGVGIPVQPWVVIVSTTVSSYFGSGAARATTTARVRATPGGTGWIKCDANYVASALAKREAESGGYMEAVFLDAVEHRYLEEGSSCNLFVVLRNGTLVTPSLDDTILPGITRASVLALAGDAGIRAEERRIAVDEVMSDGAELFATGTAAGVTAFESLSHEGRTARFGASGPGPVALHMLKTLKGIQYGLVEDTRGWMVDAQETESQAATA